MLMAILAVIISSLVSVFSAFWIVKLSRLLGKKSAADLAENLNLTAFSSGVLLATAILHLIPEAIEQAPSVTSLSYFLLGGVLFLFFMERMVLWYHHHHGDHGHKPSVTLILFGDSIHNVLDGVAIVSSFLVSPALGWLTTFAITMHEFPQEIANFSVLFNSGMNQKKAVLLKIAAASTALLGALVAYLFRGLVSPLVGYVSALTAGMFLYISLADLIPELHTKTFSNQAKWHQLLWLGLGIGVVVLLGFAFEKAH